MRTALALSTLVACAAALACARGPALGGSLRDGGMMSDGPSTTGDDVIAAADVTIANDGRPAIASDAAEGDAPSTGGGDTRPVPGTGDVAMNLRDGAAADRITDTAPIADAAPARSYVVEGRLAATPLVPLGGAAPYLYIPQRHSFTLRVDPGARTIALGGRGHVAVVSATSADGKTFTATEPISTQITSWFVNVPPCGPPPVTYSRFTVSTRASGKGIEGIAEGTMNLQMGDAVYAFAVRLVMGGDPDDQGPAINVDRPELVDPLTDPLVSASEALPAGSTAALVAGTTRVALLPFAPMEGGGLVAGFRKPQATALLYGTTYSIDVNPGTDLAGNRVGPPGMLTSLPPPSTSPEDGFESVPTTTLGGAMVVDASTLPPISGKRSVYLPPSSTGGERFTVRLPVAATDKVVRLLVRPVSFAGGDPNAQPTIRVAVPGGPIVTAAMPGGDAADTRHMIPGGDLVLLGKIAPVEVQLPAGAGPGIVVDVASSLYAVGCGQVGPRVPGVLIDDLRVE